MKSTSILFLLGILLVGCAKEKKYKEVPKDNTFSKLSEEDVFVYVPSVENTPMNVTASRPYWLGDQKLVKFKFTERTLEVLEIPAEKKYAQNENNYSPVFKLDIEHKDYRCAEDEFGECSNKEEEVLDRPWQSKPYFKADFSKLTVLETNTLPEQLTNLFEKCFEDKGSVVKALDMDKDSVNITVERTLAAGIKCADVASFDDLRNLTFKVNYHYSFVKLSKLASENYEPVTYPFSDQNTFGFFTTEIKKLTADNRLTLDSDKTLMNRWNPKRKEITYHLNEEFYREGMESIRAATEKAMVTINKSFSDAGIDFKINIADGRGKVIGDVRNNFLVLVSDPQASGVIGYGPSIANPLTGEIIKGQVVMYYGTIRKFIQDTYDEMVIEAREKAALAESETAASSTAAVEKESSKVAAPELVSVQENQMDLHNHLLKMFQISKDVLNMQAAAPLRIQNNVASLNPKTIAKLKSEIFSHERMMKTHSVEDEVEEMSRNNLFHHSMVNWNEAVGAALEDNDLDLTDAKLWNELTDDEKEVMITKLMPNVWIPTLVHEFGHNLGLRHNFSGSEDKDNYYTEEERHQHGMDRKRNITYSSVMDYSYSSLNQLAIMGKYDLAALRFAFNREVELKDGTIAKMTKPTLEEMKKDASITLKAYEYCTDEHTSVNAGCNRFDEGSDLKEIAEHYVKAYKKNYEKRNKRNNRLNFSSVDDAAAYSSTRATFEGLRIFFESFDRIKGIYPDITAAQWEDIPFLKELKAATKVAADFYVDVIKTPSVHCGIWSIKDKQLVALLPLEQVSTGISCFDEESTKIDTTKYLPIATTGRHLNHARGPELRGDIKADPSQLSIRGIWADKIMAVEYLMKREMKISTFDDYRTSFLDHPEFKDQVMEAVLGFMSNKISTNADLLLADGRTVTFKHVFEVGNSHNITKSFSSSLNNHLGLKKASTDFRELMFPLIKKNLMTADDETTTAGLLRSLSAIRVDPTTAIEKDEGITQATIKDAQGRIIGKYVALNDNILATELMKTHAIKTLLDKIDQATLAKVLKDKMAGTIPEIIPEELKKVYEVDIVQFKVYLDGKMMDDSTINKSLNLLSM